METVTVRRQYGEAIVTLPAEVLEMLSIEVGSKLDFDVSDGVLTVRPAVKRKGYPLLELLQGQVGVAC